MENTFGISDKAEGIKKRLIPLNLSHPKKCTILIVMNMVLLAILLLQFYPSSGDRIQSHYVTSQAISIAISKINYGLDNGYSGYRNVLDELLKIESGGDTGILISRINIAIDKTLHLPDVTSAGLHYMPNLPTWSDFVTMAYFIFGPNAKSIFYLYMMLLTVSILVFIMTFRYDPRYLYVSLVFIATFIVVINAPAVVAMTRVCHRFWSYLAIMPALYIAILFIDRHQLTVWKFLGALIQALMLVFIIHVRNVAIYSFVFLFMIIPLFIYIKYYIKSRESNVLKFFIKKISAWPLVLLLVCFIAMNMYKQEKLSPDYSNIKAGYPFWHMIYVSFVAHPDACIKYKNCRFSDAVAYKFVEEKMGKTFNYEELYNDLTIGRNPKEAEFIIFFSPIYGRILRDEVIRIIKEDTWFFISSFYYKIKLFSGVYKKGCDGIGGYISPVHPVYKNFIPQFNTRWFLTSIVVAGFFLAKNSQREWHGNFSIVSLMFLSAFIMLLLAYPHYSTIMDPSFTLTAMIFIIISMVVYYLWCFIMMIQKHISNRSLTIS